LQCSKHDFTGTSNSGIIAGLFVSGLKELLSREQHGIATKCIKYKDDNSVWKFFDNTSYESCEEIPSPLISELCIYGILKTLVDNFKWK
jgi:hypothetical protein